MYFVTATTLSAALVIDNILNGLARPFFGWVSDVIGRENTMGVVFTLGAAAYWSLGAFGHTPYLFILFAGFVFFTWGEIFSLFPRHRHRCIWCEIRRRECGAPLHRKGDGGFGRAAGELDQELHRQLALGLRHRRHHKSASGNSGLVCAQADAQRIVKFG